MGIHYTRKAFSGQIQMEKKAKKEQRRAQKRANKLAKSGIGLKQPEKKHDVSKPLTLDAITSPDKNE